MQSFVRYLPSLLLLWCLHDALAKCDLPLGLASRLSVPDANFTASSSKSQSHHSYEARLNGDSSWCANDSDIMSPWLQVSFGNKYRITAIRTQGSRRDYIWVKKFRIEYKVQGGNWSKYPKDLQGNDVLTRNRGNTVKLDKTFVGHHIRILPLYKEVDGISPGRVKIFSPCLRMELYGCRLYSKCPPPRHSPHSTIVFIDRSHQGEARFKCDASFALIGRQVIKCNNGRWSHAIPVCTAQCPDPGIPKNGYRTGISFLDNMAVRFNCKKKFDIIGSRVLRCRNGTWSAATPICQVRCQDPGSPANGGRRVPGGFKEGQNVTFFCRQRFVLFGNNHITCRNGRWTGYLPQCKKTCDDPGFPVNGGRRGSSFIEGQSVQFFCHKGYRIVGKRNPMCIDGRWSSRPPLCKTRHPVRPCKPPSPITATNMVFLGPIKKRYNKGEKVKYGCRPGYFSIYGQQSRTCRRGRWSRLQSRCLAKSCSDPGKPRHGTKHGLLYNVNQVVRYTCKPGFNLHGASAIFCLVNATWSSTKPECKRVDCGQVSRPLRGQVYVHSTTYGSIATFKCNRRGYILQGSRTRRCQADGRWSGTPPYCARRSCGRPKTPIDGSMVANNGYSYTARIVFKCRKGYQMIGSATSVCLDNGTWSSPPPSCSVHLFMPPVGR